MISLCLFIVFEDEEFCASDWFRPNLISREGKGEQFDELSELSLSLSLRFLLNKSLRLFSFSVYLSIFLGYRGGVPFLFTLL